MRIQTADLPRPTLPKQTLRKQTGKCPLIERCLRLWIVLGTSIASLLVPALPLAAQNNQRLVYASAEGTGTANIYGWVVNTSSGTLNVIPGSPFNEGFDPHAIAIDPSGKFLYVVNVQQNDVSAFTIDSATGALTPVPNSPFAAGGGTNPLAIVIDPTGQFLYVLNETSSNSNTGPLVGYYFGSVNSYSIDSTTGALVPTTSPSLDLRNPLVGSSSLPMTLLADSAGGNLFVVGGGGLRAGLQNEPFIVAELQIDPASGNLSESNSYLGPSAISIAFSAAISPNGNSLYVGFTEIEGDFVELSTSTLTDTNTFLTGETGDQPLSMAVDSTNSFLYYLSNHDGLVGLPIPLIAGSTAVQGSPFLPLGTDDTLLADSTGPFLYTFAHGAFQIGTDGALTAIPGFSVPQGSSITGIGTYGPSIPIQPVSGPVATFAPPSLSFSSQPVNTASAPQQISLSNTGNQALVINTNGFSITGTNPAYFTIQSNGCSAALAPNESCTLSIAYDPSAAGTSQASLTVSDNVSGGVSTAALSGTAFVPASAVTFVPGSLSFPNTDQGAMSTSQLITVTNSGTATLQIPANGVTLTGPNPEDFSQTNSCNGTNLAISASCTITVTFQPQAQGLRTADVQLSDNAPGAPQTASLSGTGLAPFTLSSSGNASQTVSAGATAQFSLQLQPVGGFQGTISLSCTGAPLDAVCTVPSSEQLNGTNAVSFNVTVSTTARSAAPIWRGPQDALRNRDWFGLAMQYGFYAGMLSLLTLLTLLHRRRKFASLRSAVLGAATAVLLLASVLTLASCGGPSSTSAPAGTPAGAATLTVTATANGGVVQTFPLTLNVQ